MKTKVLVGALAFLFILNLATVGTWLYVRWAGPSSESTLPVGGPPELMRELDETTRQQLRAVMVDFRREVMPLQHEVRSAEDSIALLLQQDPVSVPSIRIALRRVADLRTEISLRAVERLVATKKFLTPDQQRIFFRAIMDARPRGPRGSGAGMHPGGSMRPGLGQGPRPDRFESGDDVPRR